MTTQENQMQSEFGSRGLNKNEKREVQNRHKVKRLGLNGRKFKESLKLLAKKAKNSDCLVGGKENQFQGNVRVSKANNSSKGCQIIAERLDSSCERQRTVSKKKQQSCSTDERQSFHDSKEETHALSNSTSTPAKDRHLHSAGSLQDTEIEGAQKRCITCGLGGQLMCCSGRGCSSSFHLSCINPPFTYVPPGAFTYVPPGAWHCILCIKRKISVDVYAVSEGMESILDIMMEVSDDEGKRKQRKYLIKYKGLAHIHNRWVTGKTLVLESPTLFSKFKQRIKKVRCRKEWRVPQRLLANRLLVFPEQSNNTSDENINRHYEWLVKWKGLGYDHSSWELENASFLRIPESLKLIHDFEIRYKKADHCEEDERRKIALEELPELPLGYQEHRVHVNKLYGCWHRDENALVIDDQERVARVVLFLLALLKQKRGPFLIVTTSNALSMWEAGFSCWGSCANVVVYKGSTKLRSIIRTFEFYKENGDIMFQVLVSCCADVAEDKEFFQNMNWEVVILDECQRPTILAHLDQIKLLAANMRLLLVSSQIKDWNFNYHGALSLLDPDYDGGEQDIVDANSSSDATRLKERLVPFTAYEYQSGTKKFMEFWVPVVLTDVQIEQYCASMFSNSLQLCSSLKCDSTDPLHDILVSTRKCCDHPFLADWDLRSVVLKDIPRADHFDVEIQLSGKLQLLDKILSEIERRRLRVVIFFQLLGNSGEISIGDMLDDFILQKFGQDAHIRISGYLSRAQKQAAYDMFNSKDNEKFICLIEARACLPRTKLSSVDTIIIFNSDWDPLNDMKTLQKINIDSKFEQINIFRFYSSCTVEEKLLMLAKEGVILDSNIKNIKRSKCHKLLTWGASYLFRKLDGSTEFSVSALDTINSPEQTLLEDVFLELLHLLPHSSGERDSVPNSNHILNVQQNEGTYHGRFSLHGELIVQSKDNFSIVRRLMDTEPPHTFWSNLFEGKQPKWKYNSSTSKRTKRKVKCLVDLPREYEDEEAARKKANRITNGSPRGNFITKRVRSSTAKRHRRVNNLSKEAGHIACAQEATGVRSSTLKRHRRENNVSKDAGLITRVHEATGAARDYAKNVQHHCEAINLSNLARSTNNDCLGGEPDSLAECCSPPDQSHPPSNSTSARDCAVDGSISLYRGVENGHMNGNEGYVSQGQPSSSTSMQGLACQSISSIQHEPVQNLVPHPSATSKDGSEPDAASVGHVNTVPHFSSNHFNETSSVTSSYTDSLQKQMAKLHDNLKLRIESEREKEIEEMNTMINKKYDMLIRDADSQMVKTKTYYETCNDLLHKQKLLAEAMLQFRKPGLTSPAIPQEKGPSPEELRTRPSIQPTATKNPAQNDQDSMGLHAADPPVQVMQESPEAPKCSARISAGEDHQSSAKLGTVGDSRTPSGTMHTSHPRPSSISTFRIPGNVLSGRQFTRAPAPHLRHSVPPPPGFSAIKPNPSAT